MPYETIAYAKRGGLAHLQLRRPKEGNAVNLAMLQELADACQTIADDEAVRAVIISGGDAPVFCEGWDRALLVGEDDASLVELRQARLLADGFSLLADLPRPVICAVGGDCLSAGLEVALACDVRLACPEARFGFPEAAWGIIPLAGGMQRLARAVGRSWALYILLTAEPVDAQTAHQMGLVSKVVPRPDLTAAAEEMAQRISQRGPIAVRYAKEAVNRGLDMTLVQALRYETDLTVILQTTQDRAEGVRAFLQKRPPRFQGR